MTEFTRSINQVNPEKSWAIIGNFDGVHLGHQKLITQVSVRAREDAARSVLVTFDPHPRIFFNPDSESFLLTTPSEKIAKLNNRKLDLVVTFDFSETLSEENGVDFLKNLKDHLGLVGIISGQRVAFGKDRLGENSSLADVLEKLGIKYELAPPVIIDNEIVSSGSIRRYLASGDIRAANAMLGGQYQISGLVGHGRKFGQLMKLPTSNLIPGDYKMLPKNGVYVCIAMIHGKPYTAVTNVGVRPTFDLDDHPVIEAHLLDFDDNIYGEELNLSFYERIRDEQKFDNAEQLQEQILKDKNEARRIMQHAF